jgi:hypothetical protein
MKAKRRNTIVLKGFFRAQLVDRKSGRILGDSGWKENQVTNYGMESCIVAYPMSGISDKSQASVLILGSGTEPASSATTLDGSNTDQASSFAGVSVIGSLTARATQAFEGSNGSMATAANIGLMDHTSGKLIAGNTYASSAMSTDQTINATYELRFTTS